MTPRRGNSDPGMVPPSSLALFLSAVGSFDEVLPVRQDSGGRWIVSLPQSRTVPSPLAVAMRTPLYLGSPSRSTGAGGRNATDLPADPRSELNKSRPFTSMPMKAVIRYPPSHRSVVFSPDPVRMASQHSDTGSPTLIEVEYPEGRKIKADKVMRDHSEIEGGYEGWGELAGWVPGSMVKVHLVLIY